jgi:hypothetical protein
VAWTSSPRLPAYAERTEEGGPGDGAALFLVGGQKIRDQQPPIFFKRRTRALIQQISICGRVEIGAYKEGERNGMRYVIAINTNIVGQ